MQNQPVILCFLLILMSLLWMDTCLYFQIQSTAPTLHDDLTGNGATEASTVASSVSHQSEDRPGDGAEQNRIRTVTDMFSFAFKGLSIKLMMTDPIDNYIYAPLAEGFVEWTQFNRFFYFITPNMISYVGVVSAIIAGKLVAHESPTMHKLSVLMFQIRTWLDALDGIVARSRLHIQKHMSLQHTSGYVIDGVCDGIGFVAYIIGCYIYLKRHCNSTGGGLNRSLGSLDCPNSASKIKYLPLSTSNNTNDLTTCNHVKENCSHQRHCYRSHQYRKHIYRHNQNNQNKYQIPLKEITTKNTLDHKENDDEKLGHFNQQLIIINNNNQQQHQQPNQEEKGNDQHYNRKCLNQSVTSYEAELAPGHVELDMDIDHHLEAKDNDPMIQRGHHDEEEHGHEDDDSLKLDYLHVRHSSYLSRKRFGLLTRKLKQGGSLLAIDNYIPNELRRHTTRRLFFVLMCFLLQIATCSIFWNRYILFYRQLLESESSNIRLASCKNTILRSNLMWIIIWFWRLTNGHSLMQMLTISIFFGKLWKFINFVKYLGFLEIFILATITELHAHDSQSILASIGE